MAEQAVLEGFNKKNATVAKTGAVRLAGVGVAPSTTIGPYDKSVHRNVGYISPDGIELSFDEESNEFIPWQEVVAIRKDLTKSVKSIKLVLWEISRENIAYFLGVDPAAIVAGQDGEFYFDEAGLPEFAHYQLNLDIIDGIRKVRLIGFDTQVSARGAIKFVNSDLFSLEVTISFFPASATDYPDLAGKTCRWIFGGFDTDASTQPGALEVLTTNLADATTGTAYSRSLTASGGTAPYSWAVTTGTLPDGLTLSSAGEIAGTPTTAGAETFTVTVTDSATTPATATKELTLTVS
ncbi:Ig domain-containing protein [Tomitella cavernea]|uniref:Major tail protein n=1 Tax=Tomitella cavernea TaxID=1387982 RepID=A0ABP9CES2_9ACTN|nr:Ig domain-containing protein [Tomitella cavernea]